MRPPHPVHTIISPPGLRDARQTTRPLSLVRLTGVSLGLRDACLPAFLPALARLAVVWIATGARSTTGVPPAALLYWLRACWWLRHIPYTYIHTSIESILSCYSMTLQVALSRMGTPSGILQLKQWGGSGLLINLSAYCVRFW